MTDRQMSVTQCDILYCLYTHGHLRKSEIINLMSTTASRVGYALYGLSCREFVRQDRLGRWYASPVCTQLWGIASGEGSGDDEVPL